MTETVRCPDCGHPNPPGSESCEHCNFPLAAHGADAPRASEPAAPPASPPAPSAIPRPPRPPRPRRPRPATGVNTTLWLFFGTVAALIVVFTAVKGFRDSNPQQIPGSNESQMQRAQQARAALEQDSTNVDAHVALADILYDTGNWPEAIVHYRAVMSRDSSRVTALVDLGVCYFNLGDADGAERHFLLALQREPHQPVALFNLGIVSERRGDFKSAMSYFHRAMQAGGDENLHKAVMAAMERAAKASGMKAPPLDQGQPGAMPPPGGTP